MSDATVERLVPVSAERYEAHVELFKAALADHLDILARDAHGFPGCPLCVALRRFIRGIPMGADERRYLDEAYPSLIVDLQPADEAPVDGGR